MESASRGGRGSWFTFMLDGSTRGVLGKREMNKKEGVTKRKILYYILNEQIIQLTNKRKQKCGTIFHLDTLVPKNSIK